jgi:hypothetical protein
MRLRKVDIRSLYINATGKGRRRAVEFGSSSLFSQTGYIDGDCLTLSQVSLTREMQNDFPHSFSLTTIGQCCRIGEPNQYRETR